MASALKSMSASSSSNGTSGTSGVSTRTSIDYNNEDKDLPLDQRRISLDEIKEMNDKWANSVPHRIIERGKNGKTIWKDAKTGDILSHFSAESPEGREEILEAIKNKMKLRRSM